MIVYRGSHSCNYRLENLTRSYLMLHLGRLFFSRHSHGMNIYIAVYPSASPCSEVIQGSFLILTWKEASETWYQTCHQITVRVIQIIFAKWCPLFLSFAGFITTNTMLKISIRSFPPQRNHSLVSGKGTLAYCGSIPSIFRRLFDGDDRIFTRSESIRERARPGP